MEPTNDLAALAKRMETFAGIEIARGYFESINFEAGEVAIDGWMLDSARCFDSIRCYVNGEWCGTLPVGSRPDVAAVYRWIPHAAQSGIHCRVPYPVAQPDELGYLDLIGYQGAQPVARMSTLCRADLDSVVPAPPGVLIERVVGNPLVSSFKQTGLKCFGEFLRPLLRHREPGSIRRLLDWGCGCGRVTAFLLLLLDGAEVFGCDIDAEAIEWCQQHLQPGQFARIDPYPPTPYPDASFDVIVSDSVFTHLTRDVQVSWLAELRRILAPGGLVLASVHGEFAAALTFAGETAEPLQEGISDRVADTRLKGIAPEAYYRGTFQTREYTLREWSKHLDILEYIERGLGNHQDLVVMQRPAAETRSPELVHLQQENHRLELQVRRLEQDQRQLEQELKRMKNEWQTLQSTTCELEHWAHELEAQSLKQAATVQRYDRWLKRIGKLPLVGRIGRGINGGELTSSSSPKEHVP